MDTLCRRPRSPASSRHETREHGNLFCPHCSSENAEASRVCAHCGLPLPPPAPSAASSPPPPPPPVASALLPPPPPRSEVLIKAAPPQHKHLLTELGDRINRFTDTAPLEGFSLRAMFSEVFKRRSPQELEDYLLVGTTRTTPSLAQVATGWPKPWFFVRILAFVAIVYVLFLVSMPYFGNPRFIPGLIIIGSLAVPLATLVLFFELNTPRNVSFYSLLMLICFGGILSLIATSIVGSFSLLNWMGPPSAGIIEEIAKLATVIVVCRQVKHKYILNGMLFGAAIGAGFAVFESAGYAQDALIYGLSRVGGWDKFFAAGGASYLNGQIFTRAWLSPFGHVVWTAIAAGALWRTKKDGVFSPRMLDRAFWKTFLVPVLCHMTWDSPLAMGAGSPGILNYLVTLGLGAVAWFVAFGLVQQGLKQVRTMQAQLAAAPAMAGSGAASVETQPLNEAAAVSPQAAVTPGNPLA